MPGPHDRIEGLGGRVLLASFGLGLVGLGLVTAVMMTLDEDAAPHDGSYGLVIAGVGVIALAGAAIGRAVGRWTLLGVGVAFLAQATDIGLELARSGDRPDRFTLTMLIVLMILGSGAIGVAVWQTVAHRDRVRKAT